MRISIDWSRCVGSGECVELTPQVFRLDEWERKAQVIDPRAADDETLMQAAKRCPTQAIILESDAGELLYP